MSPTHIENQRSEEGAPLHRLGRTELRIPALSLGGAGIGGGYGDIPESESIATVHYALAHGVRYIDTSPLYGDSERRIGLALAGVPRSDYLLSTKTGTHPERRGDYSWDGTLWSVENSMRTLKTDYIDLLLVHDPRDEADMEVIFGPRGAVEALEHLKSQGVLGSIGFGQRDHAWHRRAILSGRIDAILTYNDYHPLRSTALTDGLLALAKQHDVGVLNGSPLAHGLLIGEDPQALNARLVVSQPPQDVEKAQRLYDWCQGRAISMPAVVLQFCLRQPLIDATLTGAKSVQELTQNLAAIQDPLPEDIWTEIDDMKLTASS